MRIAGKRITPKQVFLKTTVKAEELGIKAPSHMTVYRVLKPLIDKKKQTKNIRSPGWRGTQLSVKTRAGKDLSVEYSNHVWQCDHTRADVLLVDKYGELLSRPWLTTVIDTYSRCIMGINLGFDAPSSQVVALALRHAILPKNYSPKYGLHEEWGTYGLPQHFYTDGGKDFRSPSREQLEALAKVIGIDADRLAQMLPPKGTGMKLSPIRLCAACYIENPCHQIEWQFKQTDRCHKHQLRLLSECPNCKARFQIPAMWIDGWCHRCFLPFSEMKKYQKPIG